MYNCVDDGDGIMKIKEEIEELINEESLEDINKITAEEIKKAAARLKPGKSDPSFSFSSDCL